MMKNNLYFRKEENLNRIIDTKTHNRMTLIIGLKYKEGVVLIGDTKILDGSDYYHDNKISNPLEGAKIAVGSAGFTQLSKEA